MTAVTSIFSLGCWLLGMTIRTQHIGNDFSKSTILDLTNGNKLPPGYFSVIVNYLSEDKHGNSQYNQTSWNFFAGTDEYVTINAGSDIYSIEVLITRHNSFPSGTPVVIRYSLRLDRLILLNLASKLLK